MTLIGHAHHFLDLADTLNRHVNDVVAAPDPGVGEKPPGVGDKIDKILRWIAWLATAACVAGLIITAGRMAIAHRRGDDTNVSQLGWVLAACVLIGAASGIVSALI